MIVSMIKLRIWLSIVKDHTIGQRIIIQVVMNMMIGMRKMNEI